MLVFGVGLRFSDWCLGCRVGVVVGLCCWIS